MSEIKMIPVGKIIITGNNPRTKFNLDSLNDLGESLLSHGLLQPIIVRPKGEYYELVIGERRLRASQLKGIFEIEARIQDLDDATCMEYRLIENTQREDLKSPEKGDAVYSLMEKYPEKYPTTKSVADSLKTPVDTVYKWTRTSRKISKHVKSLSAVGKLVEDHVAQLLKYDHPTQDKLADVSIKHKLTRDQMRKFVKLYDEKPFSNLDELAEEAQGIKIVNIEMGTLSPEARTEVETIIEEKKKDEAKKRTDALEARKVARAVAGEELEEVVSEEEAKEAVRRKLAQPKIITPPSSQWQPSPPNFDELLIPLSVKADLRKKISNPAKRVELGQLIQEQGFDEWEIDKLLILAQYRTDLNLEELKEEVNIQSKKRKELKFLMLEVPYHIWETLDVETVKRKGPQGRLEIKATAIELLAERLKELGHKVLPP